MKKITLSVCLLLGATAANASIYSGEVDSDAYITLDGYDLAWASPCSDGVLESSCSPIDNAEQSTYGWKIMDSQLFSALGIDYTSFRVDYSSSNTQEYGGFSYAKASGWFNNIYTHIDVSNGASGVWSFLDVADGGSHYETIMYRDVSEVPVPAAVWLFGSGLAGLIGVSRKKKQALAA